MDIHRVRFVPYAPSAINALAFTHTNATAASRGQPLRLAIGRANGDIEIWDPARGNWIHETTIRGGRGRSCEGLLWINDPDEEEEDGEGGKRIRFGRARLFSIGYSSSVTEWDLCSGLPRRESAGAGMEVWCFAAQPAMRTELLKNNHKKKKKRKIEGKNEAMVPLETNNSEYRGQQLVAGCADGTLVLLSTEDGDLVFKKYIARATKKNARALSLKFQDRHTVIAGFADSSIRVYDIRNGTLIRNMSLGAGPTAGPKEKLVWAIECLENGTIVSGDSSGEVCFWDGKNYSLSQRIKGHDADVLCLVASTDGRTVLSGSMDRRTCVYTLSDSGGPRTRWAKTMHRRFHQHDIKAMARFEDSKMSVVVSGGLDTNPILIPLRDLHNEYHRALPYVPQTPPIAGSGRFIVSWTRNEVTIWHINRHREGESKQPEENYQVAVKMLLKGEEYISTAAVAPSGTILAVTTPAATKLFQLRPAEGVALKVRKIDAPEGLSKTGARILRFSPDSKWLLLIQQDNTISLSRVAVNDEGQVSCFPSLVSLKRLHRPRKNQDSLNDDWGCYDRTINRCDFSADSNLLAISDLAGYIDTFILEGEISTDSVALQEVGSITNGVSISSDSSDSPESSESELDPDSDSNSNSDSDSSGTDLSPSTKRPKHTTKFFGQHWERNPRADLLPRLPCQALVLSFRPHKSRYGPDEREERLLVLTSTHKLLELDVLKGTFTRWSKRNPSVNLPEAFKLQRDRAMGCLWDLIPENKSILARVGNKKPTTKYARERIWFYSASWLCMFDLSVDFPHPPPLEVTNGEDIDSVLLKSLDVDVNTLPLVSATSSCQSWAAKAIKSGKGTSGLAGSKIRLKDQVGSIGKVKKLSDDSLGQWQDINTPERKRKLNDLSDEEDEEGEDDDDDGIPMLLAKDGESQTTANGSNPKSKANSKSKSDDQQLNEKIHKGFFITHRYKPILGIMPLVDPVSHSRYGGKAQKSKNAIVLGDGGQEVVDKKQGAPVLEAVVVERPFWDLELPARFSGGQEWGEK